MNMPWTLRRGDEETDGLLEFEPHAAEPADRWYPGAPAYAEILGFVANCGCKIELTDAEASDRETERACLEYAAEMMEASHD